MAIWVPIVDFPQPDTPITTRTDGIAGACSPAAMSGSTFDGAIDITLLRGKRGAIGKPVNRAGRMKPRRRQCRIAVADAGQHAALAFAGNQKGGNAAALKHGIAERDAVERTLANNRHRPALPLGERRASWKQRGDVSVCAEAEQSEVEDGPAGFDRIVAVPAFELGRVFGRARLRRHRLR